MAKTELEEAGLETDGMVESTAKLRSEILALSGVDIMENANEFKSTYKIMDELAQKWGDLSDIQQATVTELIAGKRQGNIVSSLMSNFDTAREALDTSLNSAGSAMAEHAKWSDSLEARLNKLKATWQSFSQTFLQSDFLKVSVETLKILLNILDKLTGDFGVLGTIGLGVAGKNIFSYFKGAKEAKEAIDSVTTATKASTDANIENASSETIKAEANTASTTTELAEVEANTASATSETTEATANAASTTSEMAEAEANAISTTSELKEAEANAISSTSEMTETIGNAAGVVTEAAEATANLGGVVVTAGTSATKAASGFAAFATSTAGIVAGIGILVAVLGIAYNQYKKAKEAAAEARQEAIESSKEFLDAASSFEKAYIKYSGKTDLTSSEEEELASAIQGTTNALNDKSSALQNIVSGSNDYLASLEAIADAELKATESAAITKRDNAELELKDLVRHWSAGSAVDIAIGKSDEAVEKIAQEMNSDFLNEKFVGNKSYHNPEFQYTFTLSDDANVDEIVDYYYTLIEFQERLSDANLIDTGVYDKVTAAIDKMSEAVETYTSGIYDAVKAQYQLANGIPKTAEEYISMREAILRDNEVKGLSFDTKMSIANSLDSEYSQMFDLSAAEIQARKFVGIIKGYGNGTVDGGDEIGAVETFLNIRTAVNNDECTVREYLSQYDKIKAMTFSWSEEEKEAFNTSFGLDTDSIKKQYEDVYKYLSRNYKNTLQNIHDGSDITAPLHTFERQEYLNYQVEKFEEILNGLTASELKAVIDIKGEIDWKNTSLEDIRKQIEDRVKLNEAMNFTIAIDIEAKGIEALNTALAESKSATGLTAESIATLKSRYEDLDGYNVATLFEETANGIRANSTELAKLEEEYKDLNKQEIDETLETLKKEYDKLTGEINNCVNDQEKLNDLYSERDAILDQINDVATLAAQFKGLTSAYNEWQNAQESGQDRDMYESVISGREDIEDEMSRGWLDDAAVEYLELLTGKELSTAGIEAQIAAYKELNKTIDGTNYKVWDFFTQDEDGNITSDGVFNFFDAVKEASDGTAAYIEDGKYHFNFEGFEYEGEVGDAAIAKMLGTSEELVQIILKAAEDAGFVVNIKGEYTDLANASDSIQDLNEQLKTVGATDYTFNVRATDLDYVNEQIAEAQSALQYFEDRDGKINLDDSDVRAAATILAQLTFRKSDLENPTLMSIDVSEPTTKLEEVLGLAQQLKDAKANLEIQTAIGADTTEAQAEIDSLLSQLSSEGYADIVASLSVDASSVDSAIASINAISSEQMISLGLDTSKIDEYVASDKDATVTYEKDSTEVDEYDPPDFTRTVTFNVNSYNVDIYDPSNLTRTITYKVKTEGEISEANGTANVNGTAFANGTIGGRAFKHGDWGIKGSGVALGGELGTEILVRDGKWYTIGDGGAEFFRYKQGDIIFNHKQAEELLSNGKVASGGGRGKALADGTAFAIGSNAFGLGRNAISKLVSGKKKASTKKKSKIQVKGIPEIQTDENGIVIKNITAIDGIGDNSGSGGGDGVKDLISETADDFGVGKDADKFEETIDFIEIAISRIEREIDNLDQTVNNVYKTWGKRNEALTAEIGKVGKEIGLQQSAYNRYIEEANSVGLDENWATKVRNGTIGIYDKGDFDEKTAKKIKEYKEWYEKALACEDAIQDLKQTEAELYRQRFDNVQSQYETILQGYEHTEAMLNEYVSQAEAKGHIVSKEYYNALINNEEQNIAKLKQEQSALIKARDEAVASGKIEKYSESWYDMCNEIDGVTQSIEEGKTALIEYDNAIRDIDWQVFDLIQERISDITAEADFLIELMSNKKLFDDKGKFTERGVATVGLHGQNYNTYMYAADEYGKEVDELDKQIAKEPYDQELINRRRELVELQRESILAAEDEKNAIRDLVEEGINIELDALQERIDLHNEELDSMKDLHDYQKKVKEQTEEIASLEKQMAAYSGDDSEEAKQKVQQIKLELENAKDDLAETEYDKLISDSSAMLDELYNEYELILNQRLDNIDFLLEQVINGINAAAGAEGTITSALGAEGAIVAALGGNTSTIKEALTAEAGKVGATLSTAMNNIWSVGDGNAKSVLTTYGKGFQDKQTTTNTVLNGIKVNIDKMVSNIDKDAQQKVEAPETQPSSVTNPTGNTDKGSTNSKPNLPSINTTNKKAITDETLNGIAAAIWVYGSKSGWGNNPFRENKLSDKLGASNAKKVQQYINSYGASGKLYNFWIKKGKNLDKYKYNAFKSGVKDIDEAQFAWTQENGREFIVRPSDGAILTPVAKGDSVLTSNASGNIWSMANNPTEFIKDNLNLGTSNVPNNSNVQSNYTQHLDKVVFNFPNVKNYDEMLSAMQKDPNFERLLLSMTIDRIAGKSSLAKGKSIR